MKRGLWLVLAVPLLASAPAVAELSPADQAGMTHHLELISLGWDQPSVDAANSLFNVSSYTSNDWRVFFEGFFGSHRMTAPLWDYLGYPVFWWFGQDVHTKLQTALDPVARAQVRLVFDQHSGSLGSHLAASTTNRDNLRCFLALLWNLTQEGVPTVDRSAVYGWARQLVGDYPALLTSDHAIAPAQNPYVNWVRMQVQNLLCDAVPLTDAVKADISSVVRIAGDQRKRLFSTHTVLLHDNLFFSVADVAFLQTYFDSLPPGLGTPVELSVNDALGNTGATGLWTAAKAGINTFMTHVGACRTGRWEFPVDVPEFDTDCQAIVTAHEANHIVNHLDIETDPTLSGRQTLLIQQAGSEPMNYLRSMIDAGFFVSAPQEFFASISNMYMTNTELTLEVGRIRLLGGRPSPLEQFLFFVDVYSDGTNASRGYLTATDAQVQWYEIPLVRDALGRITGFALRTKAYTVAYGASGRVATLTEAALPAACLPGTTVLCVDGQPGDRRFAVDVTWSTVQGGGGGGAASAIPMSSLGVAQGGVFWFFARSNPEVLVKVLDGCAVNGKFWFFSSAGTNVGLETRVRDTLTGRSRSYTNPDVTAALPVQDVNAFDCP